MDETKRVNQYLSIEEAASLLHFKKSYLYKLTCLGKIPYYKPLSGRLLFSTDDLDAFISRGRRAPDYELDEKANAIVNASGKRRRGRPATRRAETLEGAE